MTPGTYRTAAGSLVTISGKHGEIETIDFDWLEEGACVECGLYVDLIDHVLVWACTEHEGGEAELERVE